jgi:hypothetical protein
MQLMLPTTQPMLPMMQHMLPQPMQVPQLADSLCMPKRLQHLLQAQKKTGHHPEAAQEVGQNSGTINPTSTASRAKVARAK